eukprot:GHRQ01020471.1.p2 GENE.GHRQ01020471.1~~GHRQ01020471.1.p2  ORF type:complete len:126 (+),score=29.36 GHRQ01020471.1:668-1045(+)
MFFGGVINPGKPVPLVPHPEGWALHISQACLPASVKEKSRVSLLIKVQGEEPVALRTLCAGVSDTALLVGGLTCAACCRQASGHSRIYSSIAATVQNLHITNSNDHSISELPFTFFRVPSVMWLP